MIDLLASDEQLEIVASVAGLISKEMPITRVREIAGGADGFDRGFSQKCASLGLYTLGLSEASGGLGLSLIEETLIFRLFAQELVPGPYLGTVLAARTTAALGERALTDDIASGKLMVGLAEVQANPDEVLLWDTGPVDLVIVLDRHTNEVSLVERPDMGRFVVQRTIDPLYRVARARSTDFGPPVAVSQTADQLALYGTVLLSAQLVGLAERSRDMGAQYARDRIQFGRQIGTFQAVKHRAADCALRAEAAWAQTVVAALKLIAVGPSARFHVAAARVVSADAAIRNGRDNIQNHGAIGFTAEHNAHLYLKRAHILSYMLGDNSFHLAAVLASPVEG